MRGNGSVPPIFASGFPGWNISLSVCVCVSVLFTLADLLIGCCLAVTGRRLSLALSHRCPCTLSSCCQGPSDSGECSPHCQSVGDRHASCCDDPSTHPTVRSLSVTAVSDGINIKQQSSNHLSRTVSAYEVCLIEGEDGPAQPWRR